MSGTAPHSPGHAIDVIRWTTPVSGKPSRIVCECSWAFEALPDRHLDDPHRLLELAYLHHRATVLGRRKPKMAGQGWVRMSLERTA